MPKKSKKITPFSLRRLFGKAIPLSLNVELLAAEGATLAISLLAFVGFSLAMLLIIGVSFLLVSGIGFFPIALFVVVLGLALGVLGLMGINTFIAGVQYHLAMQGVTRKPMDVGLAWKLSAARFRDAFIVQGSLFALVFSIAFLALLPAVLLLDAPTLLAAFASPSALLAHAPLTLLVLCIFFLFIQPFLVLALPVAYFENATPTLVLARVQKYAYPHYMGILGVVIVLAFITGLSNTLVDWVTNFPLAQNLVRGTASLFVIASGLGFLLQIAALLFAFTLNLVTQTLLYLHMGRPQEQNTFRSSHPVAQMLSGMVHTHPRHARFLPVKWKTPGNGISKKPKSR